jgi:hypothetical protein
VAVATSAKKKHGKKAPGGLQTLKISNNFGAPGRQNPPRAAKLDSGEIKLGMLRKRPAEGTPRKMARGGEVKFPFRLDRKRAYAARSAQARPPAIATKYADPDDQANQWPYGSHGKAGAPKVPTKGGHGLKVASSNEDDSDDDEIVCVGTTKPALLRALVAAKDGHGVEIACVNEDNSDDNKSVIAGASKPAWLQAAAATAELNSGVSGTPHKKARGGEEQSPFCLDRARAHAAQSAKAKSPAISTKHDKPDDRTDQRPYGGHGKTEEPKAPAKGGHGHKITSRGKDGSDGNEIARKGATKPAWLQALASAAIRGKVGARRGDGGAGMYPDDGAAAAARFVPGAKGRMPNDEARTALESLTGAEVVRRALAALRNDTDKEEEQDNDDEKEPSGDGNDSGFVITQDDDSEDDKTSGGEAPKMQ